MQTISLTDFVDFVLKTGIPKMTKVQQIKNRIAYVPATDFWKPFRDSLIKFHKQALSKGDLDALIEAVSDKKKAERYQDALAGYKKFLGKKNYNWFDPPKVELPLNGLTIRVNPELGLLLNGKKQLIKLYMKSEKLNKQRASVILAIMKLALPNDFDLSILRVAEGTIIPYEGEVKPVLALLHGEAASFVSIWNDLE